MKATLTLVLVLLLAGGTFFVVRQGMLLGEKDVRPPARLPDRAPQNVGSGAQPQPAFAGEDAAPATVGIPWELRNAEGGQRSS